MPSQGLCGHRFHREAGGGKQSPRSWLSFPSEDTSRNDNDISTVQEQDFLLYQLSEQQAISGENKQFHLARDVAFTCPS